MPYGAGGYSYKVVQHGDLTGFQSPTFDAAAAGFQSDRSAPFSNPSGCGNQSATDWPSNTDLLLRREVSIPPGAEDITVSVAIDNDEVVYWNGTQIGSDTHDGCASLDSFTYAVPAALAHSGPNLLAVRGIDRGDATYLDVTVRASVPPCAGSGCPVGGPLTLGEILAGAHNPSEFCLTCFMGKLVAFILPVDAPTGNFWHTFDDFRIPGRGPPLDLARTYNSMAATTSGPFGRGWSFNYAMQLGFPDPQHVTVNQENGTQVTFTKESNGTYSAPPRVTATLAQVGSGWLFVRRARSSFAFDSTGKLIAETDLNGYVTSLAYDAQGQLSTVTDSAGRTLSFAYAGSLITSVTDPAGRVVRYGYDSAGDLTDVTDVGGGDSHFTYDSAHQMLTMQLPNQAPGIPGSSGAVVTNVYDSQGRVVSQADQLGRKTAFAYEGDPSSQVGGTVTITDPNGHVTSQAYRFSELTAETRGYGSPQAATWKFDYDQATLGMTTVTDPNGHSTTSTFDAAGNTLTSTDAMGRKTINTYDERNDPLTTTDPRGVTTTMTYDARGNLLTRSRPLLGSGQVQVTRYVYGDSQHPGDVTAMIDPTGHTWRYRYDAYGDRTATVDPIGDVTGLIFNNIGWPMARVDARGYRTTLGHNAFGDTTTTTDPLGHTTSLSYDPDRNLVARRDASGRLTRYIYDAADQQTTIIRGNATRLRTVYDGAGNPVNHIDGLGHVTTYAFDPLNRVSAMTDPLGRRTTYTYDGVHNRLSLTNPQRQTITYKYDPANELTSVRYSDRRTHNVSLAYDPDGNRTIMTDGTGTSHYTYDSLNRMTRSTDGRGVAVNYRYDLRGDRTTVVYPGRRRLTRSFDGVGRLAAVRDWLGHTTTFSYDRDGDLTAEHFPGRATDIFSYDRADRLVHITDGNGRRSWETFRYRRDASGLITSDRSTGHRIPSTSHHYRYTGLAQLSRINRTRLGYNAADNLTVGATESRLAYDRANEVTHMTVGRGRHRGVTTFAYDARGNRTASRTRKTQHRVLYRYDQENRLVGYGRLATYSYDGDGLRMGATVRGRRRRFVWDLSGSRPMLLGDGQRLYVYGPATLPLEQVDSHHTLLYYHHDQLGSTRALTDLRGRVRADYSYGAYGLPERSVAPHTTPLKFAGEYQDSESGLYYLRARYYDPTTSQFLTADPAVDFTMSPYAYVGGDPLNATDPTGMFCLEFWNKEKCANALTDSAVAFANSSAGERANAIVDRYSFGATSAIEGAAGVSYDHCSANWQDASNSFAGNAASVVGSFSALRAIGAASAATGLTRAITQLPGIGKFGGLFGRGGSGLLNSNDVVRAGWSWKGTGATGRDIFRIGFGDRGAVTVFGRTFNLGHLDLF